jgi:hypothetical protein
VTINRLLDHTSELRISEEEHGPPSARRYEFLPTYFLRGLTNLTVDFTSA